MVSSRPYGTKVRMKRKSMMTSQQLGNTPHQLTVTTLCTCVLVCCTSVFFFSTNSDGMSTQSRLVTAFCIILNPLKLIFVKTVNGISLVRAPYYYFISIQLQSIRPATRSKNVVIFRLTRNRKVFFEPKTTGR